MDGSIFSADNNMFSLQQQNDENHQHVKDVLQVMKVQEYSMCGRYQQISEQVELKAVWRRMLLDWMYCVVEHCGLQRTSVAAAAYFLDVAFHHLVLSRSDHQLAAATALQLALKTFDSTIIETDRLVALGRGKFTAEDMFDMELKILQTLEWRLHPTTCHCFLMQYQRLLPETMSESSFDWISQVSEVAAEVTVLDPSYSTFRPSTQAFAAMLVAIEMLDDSDISRQNREYFLLNMNNIVGIDADSESVQEACRKLKESLEESPRMKQLLEALGDTSQCLLKHCKSVGDLQTKFKDINLTDASPRAVQSAGMESSR